MDDAFALLAGADPLEAAPELALFSRFLGDWSVANRWRSDAGGDWQASPVERVWSFRSILHGTALQDVIWWPVDGEPFVAGTTVRFLRPGSEDWAVHWFSPASPELCVLSARADGDDIALEGRQLDGRAIRWRFSGIRDDGFTWDGWCSDDDGASWWHEQHMEAVRRP